MSLAHAYVYHVMNACLHKGWVSIMSQVEITGMSVNDVQSFHIQQSSSC